MLKFIKGKYLNQIFHFVNYIPTYILNLKKITLSFSLDGFITLVSLNFQKWKTKKCILTLMDRLAFPRRRPGPIHRRMATLVTSLSTTAVTRSRSEQLRSIETSRVALNW